MAEYAIIASLIAVVLAAMGPGFRRSVQQVVKSVVDMIGFQSHAEQASNLDQGFLNAQSTNVQTTLTSAVSENQGRYTSTDGEHSNVQSVSYVNGAFVDQ